jgi:hypothetical protein
MLYIKISIVELCMAWLDFVQMEHPPLSQLSGGWGGGGASPPLPLNP